MRWALLALQTALLCSHAAAQNLYPDPGFERTGEPGIARSGERAGHVSVGAMQHWVTIGGALAVQPFATYRATGWAKASVARGAALGLYVYQWDSYVWAFSTSVDITHADDWTEISTTFCVPQDTVFFHPVALMDAEQANATIDDVTIEMIRTPEETLAQLRALAQPTGDAARLLVRHYVAEGDLDAARALLDGPVEPGVRADIACVIARGADDTAVRAAMLGVMIQSGAADLNDGPKRIAEVAGGLDLVAGLQAVAEAAQADAGPAAARGLLGYIRWADDQLQSAMCAERGALLAAADEAVRRLEEAAPAPELREEVDSRMNQLERDRAALGDCRILIDGHAVTPDGYSIVLPQDPTPQERTAARELSAHIERVTGQPLPIDEGGRSTEHAILLGRAGLDVEELSGLGLEGIRLVVRDGDLIIGGGRRGVLYAVYTFLEDHIGCRWFTHDCQTWPTTGDVVIGELDITYIPPLEYRATDYPKSRIREFAVRNKYNGTLVDAPEEWGANISYRGFVHTFNALVPPERYFADHPEYFSEVNGARIGDYTQLCLTNPDVLRIAIESVRRWIDESPEATIISVSQNDWHNYCTCEQCAAVAEEEGAQSGPLLRFVNAIAEDIAKDYPHVIIDTLAYQYTRKPPTITRPRDNVAVRLCSIECEFNRPLAESEFNAAFVEDIRGWNRICDRLHIWDYVINYRHCVQPFPNLRVLGPNIAFFIENGVTGIYEEANYFSHGGEFAELRTYLMAKLLWDPTYDVVRGVEEFCRAYYGAAADAILAYIEDIHELAVADDDFHMTIYVDCHCPFQTDEALSRYEALFDAAEEAVADDPVRLHRVRVARLPVLYTRIAQGLGPVYEVVGDTLRAAEGTDLGALLAEFTAIAQAEGLTAVSEGSPGNNFDVWRAGIRTGTHERPLVRLTHGDTQALIIPSLGGRVLSLTVAEQEQLMVNEVRGGIDPEVGGYEEFSEQQYRSAGWFELYEVVEQSADRLVVASSLPNGLALRRTYTLGDASLTVSTALTNASETTRPACIRVHPSLRLDDAAQAELLVGGEARSLAEGATRESEIWLRDAAKPDGEWAVRDTARATTIRSRFSPEQVDACYLNWSGPAHRVNLELWSPPVRLEPGETIALEHAYEFALGHE